jgi:RND family efflux transporter MFP subunit
MIKRIAILLIAVAAGVGGWTYFKPGAQKAAEAPAQAKGQGQVTAVSLVAAKRMDVPVRVEANGYVSSLNSVEVRPQVTNVIAKVHVKEGQFVKAGELLFTLDDRADRVNLQKAEAQLARDRATLADLERQLTRSKELLAKGFISQGATDTVQSQAEAQRAALQADQAAVEAARVALGYDTIRAPSSGRAGAIAVYPGSLVQPTPTAAPLVTISQLDPIAVTFTLPESELDGLLAAQKSGDIKVSARAAASGAALEGKVSFVDNAVDSQNGTIKVKAIFPNQAQALWPGQYITVNTVVRTLKDAIVVPQASIITGAESRTVYAVSADKTAQARRIELVHSFGTQAVVKGVQEGERIVVEGKQNLRPGARVAEAAANAAQRSEGSERSNRNDGAQKG